MPWLHCIRAGAIAAAVAVPAAAATGQPAPTVAEPSESSFTVFLRGVPVGSEQAGLTRDADGWTIASSGRLGAPIDVVARHIRVRYDADWKPLELSIDATIRGQVTTLETTVSGTTATSRFTVGTQTTSKTDTIGADAVLIPSPFWGPFEAVAMRLKEAPAGATLHAYAAPQVAFDIEVGESTEEKIQTTDRLITVRRTRVKLMAPPAPLDAEVWGDENGRLLRLSVPAQNVDVVREDIASVAARRVTISRPNDEQVTIPSNGFSLAGTISKPLDAGAGPLPAIVLVGGSGPTDRDETVFGIPIFGQLAGSLADAGYLVLRYDKRGVGQSGGRPESATLGDYAADLRKVIDFLDDRKDVDDRRIAVAGHSEGGSVAMLAASKEKHIKALVLIDTIGVTGAELNMEQVQHALDRAGKSPEEQRATIALQQKIQQAVLTGSGWEGIPPALRKQADTPWFQSFLRFDPAKVMEDVDQPVLIVQSGLDTQVAASNADKLAALADARKHAPKATVVKIPGINHLLVPAKTGEVDEVQHAEERTRQPRRRLGDRLMAPDDLRPDDEVAVLALERAFQVARTFLDGRTERPVAAGASLEELRRALGGPLPAESSDPAAVVDALARAADPGLVATTGPRYFGFVTGGTLPAAMAADWLATVWDQHAGLYVAVARRRPWSRRSRARGCSNCSGCRRTPASASSTGAHMANLTALAAARHEVLRRAGWDVEADGLHGAPPVRGLAGAEAARVDARRAAPARIRRRRDRRGRGGRSGAYAAPTRCGEALAASDGPAIVCAQAGNVNSGAFDPLERDRRRRTASRRLAARGRRVRAMGRRESAVAAPLAAASERADSWAIDGHKWLNVPYDSGMAFVAHPAAHRAAMRLTAAYLARSDDEPREAMDWVPEVVAPRARLRRLRGARVAGTARRGRFGRAVLPAGAAVRRAGAGGAGSADPQRGGAESGAGPRPAAVGRRRRRDARDDEAGAGGAASAGPAERAGATATPCGFGSRTGPRPRPTSTVRLRPFYAAFAGKSGLVG